MFVSVYLGDGLGGIKVVRLAWYPGEVWEEFEGYVDIVIPLNKMGFEGEFY